MSDFLIKAALSLINSELFIKKSIKDLISGYDDTIMMIAKNYVPSLIKDNKFSLLFGVNLIQLI